MGFLIQLCLVLKRTLSLCQQLPVCHSDLRHFHVPYDVMSVQCLIALPAEITVEALIRNDFE